MLFQVLEHNLNSSYACAGLTLDCWVIHEWLQRDGDDQENLVSARFYVHWKFCFGRRVNLGCWTLWQACDWIETSEISDLMSGFASKCLPPSLFFGAWESMVFINILIEAVICLAALCISGVSFDKTSKYVNFFSFWYQKKVLLYCQQLCSLLFFYLCKNGMISGVLISRSYLVFNEKEIMSLKVGPLVK